MRKLIYAIGVSLFLAFMAFHVATSLTNPYFGMSVEALAQGSGSGGTSNKFFYVMEDCGSLGYYVCCCSDGNSYSCDIPTSRFLCYAGGNFECFSGSGG
ncbi:MAG TPA: hypothetical protein VKZ56_09880, partial [Membranihabitans sp.]|nr:hypothetical protein [Membranihabitans sp.]